MKNPSVSLLLLVSFVIGCFSQEQLKVAIYYEALCGDSMRFIKIELFPGYKNLGNSLDIHLVPYGKAIQYKIKNKWVFQCQHGAMECYLNEVQACVLANESITFDTKMNFINCAMSYTTITGYEQCAESTGISWNSIYDCSHSSKGDELLVKFGDLTHNVRPKITFVPTIIFNDVYNSTLQNSALVDFTSTACSLLKEPKPPICSNAYRNYLVMNSP